MAYSQVFHKTYDALMTQPRPHYLVSVGGTRSGKTYAILQILDILVEGDNAGDITSVVSETLPHLKKGAIRDFESIRGTVLRDDPRWNESDHIYTYPGGGKLEFFSADTPSKVQGPARKRLFLNEAINIDYEIYRQLAVRTSGLILMDYNPAYRSWIDDKMLIRDGCAQIHSTYKDNDFLTPEQIAEIESNRTDDNWWRVYGKGELGVLEGLIFPNVVLVDSFPKERADSVRESYGLDYGFTNDTSTLIHCLTDNRKRELWFDEVFYRIGMLNSDMAAAMKQEGISRNISVYADAAEPKTNEELKRYGYNMQASIKAKKSEQLQAMKGYTIYITKRSLNMIREVRGYVWQKDKDGTLLNEPIGVMDHTMDAARYGCFPNIKVYRESHSTMSRT